MRLPWIKKREKNRLVIDEKDKAELEKSKIERSRIRKEHEYLTAEINALNRLAEALGNKPRV